MAARRCPVGAEVRPGGAGSTSGSGRRGGGASRSWSRAARRSPLEAEEDGYFAGLVARGAGGDPLPLPARRRGRLPRPGLALPARRARTARREVVDPAAFRWTDGGWRGRPVADGQVIYEMHVGTFTREGTWAAAVEQLPDLADLGVTVLEVMPVAEFPGRFGWGYDGVDLFAPTTAVRRPGRLPAVRRRGPRGRARGHPRRRLQPPRAGRQLPHASSPTPTSPTGTRPSGARRSTSTATTRGPVREFFLANAGVLDRRVPPRRPAARRDAGDLRRLARTTSWPRSPGRCARRPGAGATAPRRRERAAGHAAASARSERAGTGSTRSGTTTSTTSAMVAADRAQRGVLHATTAARRRSSSRRRSTATSTRGSGTRWQEKRRGTPALDLPPAAFVTFLQNHDQVANSAAGERVHQLTSPGRLPGDDGAAAARPGHADAVPGAGVRGRRARSLLRRPRAGAGASWSKRGREEFLAQFRSLADPAMRATAGRPRRPGDVRAVQARLGASGSGTPRRTALHRGPAAAAARGPGASAAQGVADVRRGGARAEAFVLRYFGEDGRRPAAAAGEPRAATCTCDRRRSRCWRRRRAASGGWRCRRRTRPTAAPGRRRWRARRAGGCRVRRRWCWSRWMRKRARHRLPRSGKPA